MNAENCNPEGTISIKYGLQSVPIQIKSGTTITDLILDTDITDVLGFDPWNVRAIVKDVVVPLTTELKPGQILLLETAVNTKGVGTPKEHKCEKWRRQNGFSKKPAKGDHWRWLVAGEWIHVNYKNGHMDLASLKAVARVLGRQVRDLFLEIQTI